MHPAKRVAVNTGFLYARMAITVFISLYATRLILNALGAEDFGLFNVVGGVIAMLTFLNAAMAGATQRFMSYSQGGGDVDKQKHIFNVSVVLHFFIGILVVLLLEIAGYFLFNGILTIPENRVHVAKVIFQFMLVSTFFTIISVPYDAVINAHENMLLVAVLGIVEAFFKLSIAIYITHTTFDKLVTYGLLMASLSILLLVIRRIYCHKKYEEVIINIKSYFSRTLFREMTGFAGWSFLGSASSMISNYGQGIVVNMFFGTVVNAAQGIASQVSGQLGAFAGTMLKALNPIIDKSEGAGNRGKMLKTSMTGSKVAFFLLIFFYVPLLIETPFIFKIWLKTVPDYAILFCRLLLIRNLIEQLYVTMANSIAAVGNIRRFQIYNSILNLFPLIIAFILFKYNYPPFSLYLIFIGYSLCNGFLILYFTNKICNLPITVYLKYVVFPCLITFFLVMVLSILPLVLMPMGIGRFFLTVGISSSFFFVFTWLIGLSSEEKTIIIMIIEPIIEKVRFIFK